MTYPAASADKPNSIPPPPGFLWWVSVDDGGLSHGTIIPTAHGFSYRFVRRAEIVKRGLGLPLVRRAILSAIGILEILACELK